MKHTSRVQPFVAVTQKEANAIEMERRVDEIIQRKDLDPHLKMRLYQDRLARLINFRRENELKDERSDSAVAEIPPLIDFYSPALQPYIDDFKVIQNYNYQPSYEQPSQVLPAKPVEETTPTRAPRPTLTPSLVWDDETLGFSPTNNPVIRSANKKSVGKVDKPKAKEARELKNLQIPSYMLPRQPTRRQKGSGSRLYIRAWI